MENKSFIEKYFWIFLILGIVLGLVYPVYNDLFMSLLKPSLMLMLFLVFLKLDVFQIFRNMRNYKQMTSLVFFMMVMIPLGFYMVFKLFNPELAAGILLLTAMPAGIASPVLTDIVRGNTTLSASLAILTSLVAPVTIPVLFWIINSSFLMIDLWMVCKDLVIILFIPLVLSQLAKICFPKGIVKWSHTYTSVNVLLLFLMVFAVIGSQRSVILDDFQNILWQTGILFLVFTALHIAGLLISFRGQFKDRVAVSISTTYMNNGLAIILAAAYFEPTILVLMVLSEIPWNTMLIPFKKYVELRQK